MSKDEKSLLRVFTLFSGAEYSPTIAKQPPVKKNAIKLFLTITLATLLLVGIGGCGSSSTVDILMLTADTKAEWGETVTETFNIAEFKTSSGKTIFVEIMEQGSPSDAQQAVLDGRIRPVIWSRATTIASVRRDHVSPVSAGTRAIVAREHTRAASSRRPDSSGRAVRRPDLQVWGIQDAADGPVSGVYGRCPAATAAARSDCRSRPRRRTRTRAWPRRVPPH